MACLLRDKGYSVFAVVQTDPLGPLALPRTEADEFAAVIPEPSSFESTSRRAGSQPPARTETETVEGFEDEDMELQAALQASLAGPEQHLLPGGVLGPATTGLVAAPAPAAPDPISVRSRMPYPPPVMPTRHRYELLGREDEDDEDEEIEEIVSPAAAAAARQPVDPVAASIARNRAIMERMRREQEAALRYNYEEEAEQIETGWHGAAAAGPRYNLRRPAAAHAAEDDDEEEMVRRAIEESAAMARAQNVNAATDTVIPVVVEDDDEDNYISPSRSAQPPQQVSAPSFAPSSTMDRVYDDDDEELQAALRASLETVPAGFRIPSPPPIRLPNREYSQPPPEPVFSPPPAVHTDLSRQQSSGSATKDPEEESETESYVTAESSPVEQLSVEEIRRRRLARFGG